MVLEKLLHRHTLLAKLKSVTSTKISTKEKKRRLELTDKESGRYQRWAETKCRRLKFRRIPFLLEASKCIRQCQVYHSLLRYHDDKIRNWGNLKRSARQCNISGPFQLLVSEIKACLIYCKTKCDHFRRHRK